MMKKYTLTDLELPDDEPMVVIRSSFLWICDGDKYAAAALNMYVHWTKWIMKHRPIAQGINKKLKRQGKDATQDTSLVIYRQQADLVLDMLGFCSEKRLSAANKFLVGKELIKIDDSGAKHFDHIFRYELNIDVFKERLKAWKKYRDENKEPTEDQDDVDADPPLQEGSNGAENFPLPDKLFTVPGTDNLPLQEQTIYRSNNIDNKIDVYRDDKENITAQSPNGSVQSFSSSLTFTPRIGRPRPTEQTSTPEQPKQERPKKQVIDTAEIQRVMDAIDKAMGAGMVWAYYPNKKGAKDLAEMSPTDEQIATVISGLKQTYQGKTISMHTILTQWGCQLGQSKLTYINPSTQDKPAIDYNDPNFNPGTLSLTEYAEWTEWKQEHQHAS